MLIGLVAPAVMRQFASSKHKIAEQAIARLVTILDMYKLDVGDYPTNEQGLQALYTRPAGVAGWNGPYIHDKDGLNDPWGRPMSTRSRASGPTMSSTITARCRTASPAVKARTPTS